MDNVRAFKIVSIAEAISWILLASASLWKNLADGPKVLITVLGPIHGMLFIGFVGLVFATRKQLRWDGTRTFWALVSSVVPFAPFYVERNWIKEPVKA